MKRTIRQFLNKGVFIIAEAGVNHNKDVGLAFKLVDIAKESGADAVKFQTFVTEKSISRFSEMAPYQKKNLKKVDNQFDMAKELELSFADFEKIKKYCDQKKILFLSTPDEEDSLEFLCKLDMPVIKIGSGEINNFPLLQATARTKRPIILSTGVSTIGEVRDAMDVMAKEGNSEIALLHCVTEYPAPIDEINLRAMLTLKNEFNVPVGFSDHTQGIEISLAAVALGAEIIEKHFTIDQNLPGPDHKASLNPQELKQMVNAIRNIEKSLGNGVKQPAPCELKNRDVIRRSIVAQRNLKKGNVISAKDVTIKKPGYGLPSAKLSEIMGLKIKKDIQKDQVLTWECFK